MSLFDIIRYSGTNLSSMAELLMLPEELIDLYWKNSGFDSTTRRNHEVKCKTLSDWYTVYPVTLDDFRIAFAEALKEYSLRNEDEPIRCN